VCACVRVRKMALHGSSQTPAPAPAWVGVCTFRASSWAAPAAGEEAAVPGPYGPALCSGLGARPRPAARLRAGSRPPAGGSRGAAPESTAGALLDAWTVTKQVYVASTDAIARAEAKPVIHISTGTGGPGNWYVAVSDKLPKGTPEFADVWRMFVTPDGMFFQAINEIFLLSHDTFTVIPAKSRFGRAQQANGHIYVGTPEDGLNVLEGSTLKPLPGTARIGGEAFPVVLPYDDHRLLIGTRRDGLFLYDGTALTWMPMRSVMGPVGACSPGIHLGYTSASSPGRAGITTWLRSRPSDASRASTVTCIGPVTAAGAARAGDAPQPSARAESTPTDPTTKRWSVCMTAVIPNSVSLRPPSFGEFREAARSVIV